MPRSARVDIGGEIYHVINRTNGRFRMFNEQADYHLFEQLLLETRDLVEMRILAYVLMPNHWHLVLYPKEDGDLKSFMHRLTNAHTRKVHARTKTNGSGHLYQGRYKSFLVEKGRYLHTLIKYVERNPVRAKLVRRCEDWQWGSAWRRTKGEQKHKAFIAPSPEPLPRGYLPWINTPEQSDDLHTIRTSVNKGVPYGKETWVTKMVIRHHLESTLKSPGRPKTQ